MRRHRTTARGIVFALLLASFVAAAASPQAGGGERAGQGVPRLVFPLIAKTELWDNYGDPRPNGAHQGIDMENPWRAPVVAVEAGRVDYWDSSLGGCMLYLYGRSGTMYQYIHLNNDLTARNDNRGGCKKDVTFAVPDGAKVTAGQQIAWNGDSGDADGNPHLHFEVHPGGGGAVSPYKHLQRAVKPLFAARVGARASVALRGRLVSVGRSTVQVEVEQVRPTGGRWVTIDRRRVELAAPPADALWAGPDVEGALLRAPKERVRVVVRTLRTRVTAGAVVGAPRSLSAARISILP
jgi:hypothetical protein